AFIWMQQDLHNAALEGGGFVNFLSSTCSFLLPVIVLCTGLLMVSNIRYPHVVNRYLRGRRPIGRLIFVVAILLLLVVAHRYTIAIGMLAYVFSGFVFYAYNRLRP